MNDQAPEHEEWVRNRRKPTTESMARALELLDKSGTQEPAPDDRIPEGYRSASRRRLFTQE